MVCLLFPLTKRTVYMVHMINKHPEYPSGNVAYNRWEKMAINKWRHFALVA